MGLARVSKVLTRHYFKIHAMSKELVIFSHIPKTAGSSVNHVAENNYDNIFSFYKVVQPAGTTLGDWIKDFNTQLSQLRASGNQDTVFLRGHFGLGMHLFLTCKSCSYITFLRHPVERAVSHFYFLMRPQSRSKWSKDPPEIEDFFYSKKLAALDNLQTRFLSGIGWQKSSYSGDLYSKQSSLKYGQCNEKMLELAKSNLSNHIMFGLQDRFTESIDFLATHLGWKYIPHDIYHNVNNKRKKLSELSDELLSFIETENKFDVELYHHASNLFDLRRANLASVPQELDIDLTWVTPTREDLGISKREKVARPPKTLTAQASKLFANKQYLEASNILETIMADFPAHIPTLNRLAQSYEKLSKYTAAQRIYRKIITIKPANVEIFKKRLAGLENKE